MHVEEAGIAVPHFIRQAWRSKTASAVACALVACALLFVVLHCIQLVLHRRHIYGFSDWREAAAYLKTHARSNDVIVTSYHDELLRFYGTNFPCALVRGYGAYDGRDFTVQRLRELQDQHARIWSILVNKYMRWNSHPAAVIIDREWVSLPTSEPTIHYWDRTEAGGWSDINVKRAKEKELLSAYLLHAPRHYLVRRHLALLQYWTGDYTASLSNWYAVARQYPFDPWNWEVPGLCYRDGRGVAPDLPRALRFYRAMYWFARLENQPDRRARVYALRYMADTYRLMKRPKHVLAVTREWERWLALSKLTPDQIEHERKTLTALRTDALDRLGLLPVLPNLLHNSDFTLPVRIWDGTPSNAGGNWSLLAPWFTNYVSYGCDGDGTRVLRVYNDASNRYTGVMQSVLLQSGSVYRLSGKARSTSDIMGIRLVAEVRPEGSHRPIESHQVVWWQGSREWQRLYTVFTNHFATPATVVLQAGYGGVISTSECIYIRLEQLH